MDGAHDMGGVAGFGPIGMEPNEPVFHSEWERRAFALTLAMARPGGWTIDMARFARENRTSQDYLSKSYYEIWLAGLEQLMAERGLVSADEIAVGRSLQPAKPVPVLRADDVAAMLQRGAPTLREAKRPARFAIGARVRAKAVETAGHTRLPRYVRGHLGVIWCVHGRHVFADANARGVEDPQWLYTVSFDGSELWGAAAEPDTKISVEAWESYLEPAA